MGIVNVTPDSFSDGGKYYNVNAAVDHALQLIEQRADIIDIGGESTRPGYQPVSSDEELKRVIPVIEKLSALNISAQISIDTSKTIVMREALQAGAHWINDVNALQDVGALELAADFNCKVCLMHRQIDIDDNVDILQSIAEFWEIRIALAIASGIQPENIVLDPGFGFGKSLQQNLYLLANLNKLTEKFNKFDILIGVSRKSMFEKLLGSEMAGDPMDRIGLSIFAAAVAALQGVKYLRVHDVARTKQAFNNI